MSSFGDATIPAMRRSRQSVSGSSPSKKAMDKENATVDVASTLAANRKKSRSKSMGPGGLDVLRSGNGNRRVVCHDPATDIRRFGSWLTCAAVSGSSSQTTAALDPQADYAASA